MCPEGKGNKFLSLLPFRPEKVSKICPPTEEQAWYQPVKPKGNMLYLLPKMSPGLPKITKQGEKLKEPAEFDKFPSSQTFKYSFSLQLIQSQQSSKDLVRQMVMLLSESFHISYNFLQCFANYPVVVIYVYLCRRIKLEPLFLLWKEW